MKFIIVSLIGIPASGKSTLSGIISKLSAENSLNANVIILNFDELIEIDFGSILDGDYKRSREELFVKIEELINKLRNGENADNWAPFRVFNQHNEHTLIILDDNMYYRSMRQRARQTCKNCKCEHFQIFVKSALNDAIERNKSRKSAVDVAVIEKMFNDMEIPINERTISVEIDKLDEEAFLSELKDRIEKPEELTEELQEKIPQDQSIIHEIDLMTRKEVGNLIKELGSGENLKEISSRLNEKRKEFIDNVRNGKILLKDVESMKISFRKFVKD